MRPPQGDAGVERVKVRKLATDESGDTIGVAVFIAAALGFPFFVWSLARDPIEPQKADGIVVLTGGEDRLPAAVKLLQAHKGDRLLISGVHHETTREQLLERV